jgi:ribosome maturation factor RimP
MSRHNPVIQRVYSIIEPVCNGAGYELVDLRLTMEHGGWTLRVCIDLLEQQSANLQDGTEPPRVDTSDCERASREISAVMDVEDPIPQAYSLEVSSPGIDRPLRTPAHFLKFVGAETKLTMATPYVAQDGNERRNFRGFIDGVLGQGKDALLQIKVDGKSYSLRIDDIDQARLVPDWDAVMRGQSGITAKPQNDAGKQSKAKAPKTRSKNSPDT